jgi:pSer/pThr/pTyr-binding forkhead associated (FHA) protein
MAKLVIYQEFQGEETVLEEFDLIAQRLIIGSGLDNDLVLDASNVEPTHASMELRNEYWVLQDLGSPGGTIVNGVDIDGPFRLQHGDLIELGAVKLRFHELEAKSEDIPPAKEETSRSSAEPQLKGRVWFAGVAGYTLALIFIIIFLLIVADYLEVIKITDLLPPWFG